MKTKTPHKLLFAIVTRFGLILFLLLGLLVSLPTASVRAATTTVTTNADSGPGSLRSAIANAAEGDTINFDNDYTITLASQLEIDKMITITGAGHAITLSGNHAVRVIHISNPTYSNAYPTLDHLNIIDGKITGSDCAGSEAPCGGGMLLEYLSGATISNSTFSGNDGGIAGGAIYSYYGNVTIINSTFANNIAQAYGGAVQVFYGNMTLINNTFYGNIVSIGGGYGSAILNNWGTVTFNNNIIVKISGPNACDNSEGTFNDGGGNLGWGDSTCPGINANPMLGALGNYGGGTPTMPLLPGSAAFDIATTNCPSADQRGVTRAATCDSGAYESKGFTLTRTGGDNQSTIIQTAFAAPLALSVTPIHAGDPVDGGWIVFTAPSSGASAILTGTPASISGGAVSVTATANAIIGGPYTITASTTGAASANFALTNTPAPQPPTFLYFPFSFR